MCVVHDTELTPIEAPSLGFEGLRFATIEGALQRLDVTIEAGRATATVETSALALAGDLALASLPIRTRSLGLYRGWLGIRHAIVVASDADAVELQVDLPIGLEPSMVHAVVRCADATFASVPWFDEGDGEWVMFATGTRTPLARTPGGPAAVTIAPVEPDPAASALPGNDRLLPARIIERQGPHLRVHLVQRNVVEGWVPAASVVPYRPSDNGFGFGRSGIVWRMLNCPGEVPIYVRVQGEDRQVGQFKPGAELMFERRPAEGAAVMEVALGRADLPAYVRVADTVACAAR